MSDEEGQGRRAWDMWWDEARRDIHTHPLEELQHCSSRTIATIASNLIELLLDCERIAVHDPPHAARMGDGYIMWTNDDVQSWYP